MFHGKEKEYIIKFSLIIIADTTFSNRTGKNTHTPLNNEW